MEAQTYKSPLKKLVVFFHRSRDGWKLKYQQLKREYKKQINQVCAVEKSRDHWKEVARQARREAGELGRQLEELKRGVA